MSTDTYDGLHVCEDCGDAYTTGRYCIRCAEQRSIDNFEGADLPAEDELSECDLYGHEWKEVMGGQCSECQRCGLLDC